MYGEIMKEYLDDQDYLIKHKDEIDEIEKNEKELNSHSDRPVKVIHVKDEPEDDSYTVDFDVDDPKIPEGKCPFCLSPMSKDEERIYGMCTDCWENGVE